METKDKNIKTTCNENLAIPIIPVPAKLTAELAQVSESYVKKIRNSDRNDNTETAQRVKYCDNLLYGGIQVLVKAVKETLTPKQ